MGLDGLVAEHEPLGDLVIRQTFRDETQDLGLSGSERQESVRSRLLAGPKASELGDQPARDRGSKQRLPAAMTRTASKRVSAGTSLSRNPLAPE